MTKKKAQKLIMSLGYQRNVACQMLLDEHNKGMTNEEAWLKILRTTNDLTDSAFWASLSETLSGAVRSLALAFSKIGVTISQIVQTQAQTTLRIIRGENHHEEDSCD